MKKQMVVCLAAAAVMMLVTGCGTKEDRTTLHIKDGGKVVENITEDFNQDNYDEKELKTFIEQQIEDYKKESERRIHRVYDRCPEGPQRSDALAATGGTSWAAVFIYLGVYIAAGVLGSFLMGPDLNAVIRFLTM